MKIDFSGSRLTPKAFSDQSMHFGHPQAIAELAAITEIIAVETAPRRARENWQQAQLRNLINHAVARSAFWRGRIKSKKPGEARLKDLPVQTRRDLAAQYHAEGSLLRAFDKIGVYKHSTSGSSGTPVEFYYSDANAIYNLRRSVAQFFMEDRRLDCNWTRFKSLDFADIQADAPMPQGFRVAKEGNWLGVLGQMFRSGDIKTVKYTAADSKALMKELSSDEIGYLIVQPRLLESLFAKGDPAFLARAGTVMVLPVSGKLDADVRKRIEAAGVPVRSSYSCEEAGTIGTECPVHAEHYHVAGSNVLVEVDGAELVQEGKRLGRVLVTHLHSYASPIIRYELGDLGALSDTCPCGFDGPTISHIHGRSKNLIKHRDGSLTPFMPRASDLLKLGDFAEYRIRQTALDRLVFEIGGCVELTPEVRLACEQFMKTMAGDDLQIDVHAVPEIDWGASVKRPLFTNEII